jgi:hypothetical protein
MMLEKLKKLFNPDDKQPDMSRRKFIKTASALAALTVAAVNVPSLLKIREIEEQIASGRVVGQTFYLTEPVVIDIPNVVIDQCNFVAVEKMDYMVKINARNCVIMNSRSETNGLVGTCREFDTDSVDWIGDMRPTFKPGDLTSGTYYTLNS